MDASGTVTTQELLTEIQHTKKLLKKLVTEYVELKIIFIQGISFPYHMFALKVNQMLRNHMEKSDESNCIKITPLRS